MGRSSRRLKGAQERLGVFKRAERKIRRLEYDGLFRADYRPGQSYAQQISASRFATRFPADPQGPDDLL